MANMSVWKGFRCTRQLETDIKEQADGNKLSESEYIRRKLSWLPPEIRPVLEELRENNRKIGVNINQVVRSCNSKHFVSSQDYRDLKTYLVQINENYVCLLAELKEQNRQQFRTDLILEKLGCAGEEKIEDKSGNG